MNAPYTPQDFVEVLNEFPMFFSPEQLRFFLIRCKTVNEYPSGGSVEVEFGGGYIRKVKLHLSDKIPQPEHLKDTTT